MMQEEATEPPEVARLYPDIPDDVVSDEDGKEVWTRRLRTLLGLIKDGAVVVKDGIVYSVGAAGELLQPVLEPALEATRRHASSALESLQDRVDTAIANYATHGQ
eukprot:m.448050 g.448050  ORF g.448050 m.448050 type:complete len:105 (+) comp19603_c0_seq1:92-406(+)